MAVYVCCNGLVKIDQLNAPAQLALSLHSVKAWCVKQVAHLKPPASWNFQKSLADILFEQTSIVYCDFNGEEQRHSPVRCRFSEERVSAAPARVYPHVLLVAVYNGERVVLGSLTSRTFYAHLESNYLAFEHLAVRETTQLFDALYLFDELDYYFLFDKVLVPPPQQVLGEALAEKHCLIQCWAFPDEAASELAPYAFQYELFAASPSDRLSQQFIDYEAERLQRRLDALQLNPLLQLEYIRKWLRVDWRAEQHDHYTHSNYPVLSDEVPNYAAYNFAALHLPSRVAFPSHIVPVEARYAGWAFPGRPCVFCEDATTACLRPPIEEGTTRLPIGCIAMPALALLRLQMRQWLQRCRAQYSTYDALRLWTAVPLGAPMDETVERWTMEFLRDVKHDTMHDRLMIKGVRDYIRQSLSARQDFRLLTDRDFVLLQDVIIPSIWRPLLDEIPDDFAAPWGRPVEQHPLWNPKQPRRRDIQDGGRAPVQELNLHFETHAELVLYSERHWAPCMQAMIRQCVGPVHLKHIKRRAYARFLMNVRIGYTEATIRNFWFLAFAETDVFREMLHGDMTQFKRSKYGRCIDGFLKKPFDNPYWPTCLDMATDGYCPFTDLSETRVPRDIEELVTAGQHTCTQGPLAQVREQMKVRANRGAYRLHDPAEWSVNVYRY